MIRTLRRSVVPALLAVLALTACGDDPTGPTVNSVAGEYRATTFTVADGGTTLDVLAVGGTLTLALDPDGTTTGRIFLPGLDEDGGDFDEDLAGTWMLRSDTVTFQQSADTLIRDLEFEVAGNRLEAEEVFGQGARVKIVLSKQ